MPIAPSATAPATHLVEITPSDSTDLTADGIRALWVGTGGDLSVLVADDDAAVTIANVADGTILPIAAVKVMAATTASDIVGLG